MAEEKPTILLETRDLKKYYPIKEGLFQKQVAEVKAVDGVSISIEPGKTLGLVGESGCGKTTLGRCVIRLTEITSGSIIFEDKDITTLPAHELRKIRKDIQIIFQDPYSSLNPRMNIKNIIGEALIIHQIAKGEKRQHRIEELVDIVGLLRSNLNRYPHEFSGGQRQRICIARALAVNPKLIIADEPLSALDVSIQAQIINLLLDLQVKYQLSYLFISHDLGVVQHMSDEVAVMYLGRIVEKARTVDLFKKPKHPYTRALLSVIPVPDPKTGRKKIILDGDVPTPVDIPAGCRFYSRCPLHIDDCLRSDPSLDEVEPNHWVACLRMRE
ncbi:ATP-binding cassette domain-containing protein [bacterium]|nr:ATP-binding cassette domain-containing protein [bacterium]